MIKQQIKGKPLKKSSAFPFPYYICTFPILVVITASFSRLYLPAAEGAKCRATSRKQELLGKACKNRPKPRCGNNPPTDNHPVELHFSSGMAPVPIAGETHGTIPQWNPPGSLQFPNRSRRGVKWMPWRIMNAPGYKSENVLFWEHLVRPQRDVPLSFVKDKDMVRILSEGPLTKSGNSLDLALDGKWVFMVDDGQGGLHYKRSGRSQFDNSSQTVNQQDQPALSVARQVLTIPEGTSNASILPDGTVLADSDAVDAIGVVRLDDPRAMWREANNLYPAEETPPRHGHADARGHARRIER